MSIDAKGAMLTELAVVVVVVETIDGKAFKYYGPFEDGKAATRYGFDNFKNEEWFWEILYSDKSNGHNIGPSA
jgi:hypothetical protein